MIKIDKKLRKLVLYLLDNASMDDIEEFFLEMCKGTIDEDKWYYIVKVKD